MNAGISHWDREWYTHRSPSCMLNESVLFLLLRRTEESRPQTFLSTGQTSRDRSRSLKEEEQVHPGDDAILHEGLLQQRL